MYKRRTGTKTDGCAVCYRSSCFAGVSSTELEFFRPETELLNRHNVGIVLLLRPLVAQGAALKESGPPLCVANTHLLFNPRRGDIKLAQLAIMLAEIDAVVKACKVKGEHCNVVLCGDFNSLPNTPLYQLIVAGELFYQGLPTWMVRKHRKIHNFRLLFQEMSSIFQVFPQQLAHSPLNSLCPTGIRPGGPVPQTQLSQTVCPTVAQLTGYH